MFAISMTLAVVAIVFVSIWGLRLGVDFKGGSVLEVAFTGSRPSLDDLTKIASTVSGTQNISITPVGDMGMILRMNTIDEKTHGALFAAIKAKYDSAIEERFDSIGPTIGAELRNKSITAMVVLLMAITVYIAIVFWKMTRVLSPWVMGFAAIFALIHDLIIPMGVFALLGHLWGIELSAVFVAAALTILGYSVSDTVVVFDRVRENVLRFGSKQSVPDLVHASIMQNLARSINTSVTTLLSLVAIFLFGGESLRYFALALIIGIVCGSYSSIFIASPILVWWSRKRR